MIKIRLPFQIKPQNNPFKGKLSRKIVHLAIFKLFSQDHINLLSQKNNKKLQKYNGEVRIDE